MHRSQFEQLIDAGLASVPQHAKQGAFRPLSQAALNFDLDAVDRVAASAKPHLSACDLRRAYHDGSYRDGARAGSSPDAKASTSERAVGRPKPALANLLGQLSNHRSMSRTQLQALRRQLARCFHPDLMSEEDRLSATAEMARLNALIDNALEQQSR